MVVGARDRTVELVADVVGGSGAVGPGCAVLDFQTGGVGFAVTVSNLSDILSADVRKVTQGPRCSKGN